MSDENAEVSADRLMPFRKDFEHWMSVVKADVQLGEQFRPTFSKNYPIDDCTRGLGEVFEMSGLDINSPGHWQELLIGLLNCYTSPIQKESYCWSRENQRLFFQRLIEARESNEPMGIEALCEKLKSDYPMEYLATAKSLKTQFQRIKADLERSVDAGFASEEEVALLHKFKEFAPPPKSPIKW